MVNAGAILTTSLIKPELDIAERFDRVPATWWWRVGFNNAVHRSEQQTADRNFALAYFMRESSAFPPVSICTRHSSSTSRTAPSRRRIRCAHGGDPRADGLACGRRGWTSTATRCAASSSAASSCPSSTRTRSTRWSGAGRSRKRDPRREKNQSRIENVAALTWAGQPHRAAPPGGEGQLDVVRYLLAYGTEPAPIDRSGGRTDAEENGRVEIVELLRAVTTPTEVAV
jgi:Glutaminase